MLDLNLDTTRSPSTMEHLINQLRSDAEYIIGTIIPIMEAYKAGKAIQFRDINDPTHHWEDVEHPSWNFNEIAYRVKPEPKELFVNLFDDGSVTAHNTHAEAVESYNTGCNKTWSTNVGVKFRQVVDE